MFSSGQKTISYDIDLQRQYGLGNPVSSKINKDDKVSSDTAFTQHSTSKMRMFFTVVTSGRFPETLTTIELSPTDLTNIESKLQELEQKYRHILQESRDRLNGPKYVVLHISRGKHSVVSSKDSQGSTVHEPRTGNDHGGTMC